MASAVLIGVCAWYALFSSSSSTILCFWGRTCDGGDTSSVYRLVQTTQIVINLPAYWSASLLPREDNAVLYVARCAALLVASAAWWFLIGFVLRSRTISTRSATLGVLAAFGVACVIAALLTAVITHGHPAP
jgi:hypothetical protein